MTATTRYGDWWIVRHPKPIPSRAHDWDYWHDDYDGAPDAGDRRCGNAASEEACRAAIDEYERENDG